MTTTAYEQSIRTPFPEVADTLRDQFGSTLLAFIAGLTSRQVVGFWTAGITHPRPEAERRVRATYRVWLTVEAAEGADTARNWFIGANPRLSEQSPAERLRDGDIAAVVAAATAFVNDQGGD